MERKDQKKKSLKLKIHFSNQLSYLIKVEIDKFENEELKKRKKL